MEKNYERVCLVLTVINYYNYKTSPYLCENRQKKEEKVKDGILVGIIGANKQAMNE